MIHEVGRPLLKGDISSALAISEPFAGSDVASIRTTAELTPDGKHFIVNGVKKWITEGCYRYAYASLSPSLSLPLSPSLSVYVLN